MFKDSKFMERILILERIKNELKQEFKSSNNDEIEGNTEALLKNCIVIIQALDNFDEQLEGFIDDTTNYLAHLLLIKEVSSDIQNFLNDNKNILKEALSETKKILSFIIKNRNKLTESDKAELISKTEVQKNIFIKTKNSILDKIELKRTKKYKNKTVNDINFMDAYDLIVKGLDPKKLEIYVDSINSNIKAINTILSKKKETIDRILNESQLKEDMNKERYQKEYAQRVLSISERIRMKLKKLNSSEFQKLSPQLNSELNNAFNFLRKSLDQIEYVLNREIIQNQKQIKEVLSKSKDIIAIVNNGIEEDFNEITDYHSFVTLQVRIKLILNKINKYKSEEHINLPIVIAKYLNLIESEENE